MLVVQYHTPVYCLNTFFSEIDLVKKDKLSLLYFSFLKACYTLLSLGIVLIFNVLWQVLLLPYLLSFDFVLQVKSPK